MSQVLLSRITVSLLLSGSPLMSGLVLAGVLLFFGIRPGFAEEQGLDPADLSVPVLQDGTRAKKPRSSRTQSSSRTQAKVKRPPSKQANPEFAPVPSAPTSPEPSSLEPLPSGLSRALPLSPTTVPSGVPASSVPPRNWGVTASLGFPHPFFLEAEHRVDSIWSAGLGLGGVHLQNIQWDGQPLEINMLAADARVRWHPWGGSFFAGVALGVQKFDGAVAATVPVTSISQSGSQVFNVYTTVSADITSIYLTPHLGWFKVYEGGLILGFELGLQVPASVRTAVDVSTDGSSLSAVGVSDISATNEYKSMEAQVQDAVETFGKTPLPYFTLVRVGWMF